MKGFLFSLKCFDLDFTPRKDTAYTSHGIIRTALNILFRRKLSVFYQIRRDDDISQTLATED